MDEKANKSDHLIEILKHSLGFPFVFFVEENKRIIDVGRGESRHNNENYETSYELNYSLFLNGISILDSICKDEESILITKEKP